MILVFLRLRPVAADLQRPVRPHWPERMLQDREARLAGFAVVVLPTLLFMRHWLGALEVETVANFSQRARGALGQRLHGPVLPDDDGLRVGQLGGGANLVGAGDAGPVAGGPCADGRRRGDHGGGAEAAQGLCALQAWRAGDGKADLSPARSAGAGRLGRRIRREGAYIAWIFFMLFILTLAAVMLALAATGWISRRR
jgi:trk system potassium uptake protein TrkH